MWFWLMGVAWATPTFPQVSGETLAGETLALPGGLAGERNLVLMATGRDDQDVIDSWLPLARALEGGAMGLRYYEVALVDDVNFALKAVIAAGMRATLPEELQGRVVPLFEARGAVLASLGLAEGVGVQVMLVDRAGVVLWRVEGAFSEEAAVGLKAVLGE